jgi:hypothetical protein
MKMPTERAEAYYRMIAARRAARRLEKIDAARDAIAEHQNAFRFDTDRGVVASDDDDALLALVERLAEI